MVLFSCLVCAIHSAPSAEGPIVIGGVTDLSAEGSVLGNAVSNGAQLAVDEINAGGGVLCRQLKYVP